MKKVLYNNFYAGQYISGGSACRQAGRWACGLQGGRGALQLQVWKAYKFSTRAYFISNILNIYICAFITAEELICCVPLLEIRIYWPVFFLLYM